MEKQQRTNNSLLKGLAERMYVEEGHTAKAISSAINISEQTISRWKKGIGNEISWDEKRRKQLTAPHNIKRLINEELARLTQGSEPTLDMKAIKDAIAAMQGISDDISAQVVYSVFREFDIWMSLQEPTKAIEIAEWHKQFLLHKAQQDG